MATRVHLRANSGYNLIVFAETDSGKFGTVITDNTSTQCDSPANQLSAVAVSTVPQYRCNSWFIYPPSSAFTYVDPSHYIFKGMIGAYSASYPYTRTSELSQGNVSVIDEHGTHIGTPTGDVKVGNGMAFGVKHESTNEGWEFLGWKVSFDGTTSYYGSLLSTGGIESDDGIVFDAEYSENFAIVGKASRSSSHSVIVEALYEEAPPPPPPERPDGKRFHLVHSVGSGALLYNAASGAIVHAV